MLYLAEGPTSVPQNLNFIAEELVIPDIVADEHSFWTPGRAVAITCMSVALLAGLAVAAYQRCRRLGNYIHELEQDLKMERTEVARLRDRLETQEEENLKKEERLDEMTHDIQLMGLQRGRLDNEKMMLEDVLEKSKIKESEMERLLNEAKEQIEFLQYQIVDKDLLIERNALERKEMESRLEEEEKSRGRDLQILDKERNLFQEKMESALKEGIELASRLKEAEATNRVLASANEGFNRANAQMRDTLEKKEKEVDQLENLKEASVQEIACLQKGNGDLEKEIKKNQEEKEKNRVERRSSGK
ncbi:myosin heavy chain, clone 203-like [Macrobrachium nipponense]|uniref:myosin heavy chain, clone 203-like n=1 Tax=Macrobrachium nipponense TaxID=159736 RepID=UPI0030C86DCF